MDTTRNVPLFIVYSLIFASIASLLVMLLFPIRSTDTAWKEYRILAVSPPEHEMEIVGMLRSAGIGSIVTESNSMLPRRNPLSPIQPFIDEANRMRSSWFSNPENGLRFFFLPDEPHLEKKMESALAALPASWYLEGTAAFFLFLLVPPLLLLITGYFIQKNRLEVILGAVPAMLLAFSWNNPAGMASASLMICTVVAVSDVIHAGHFEITGRQRLIRMQRNPFLFIPLLVALIIALSCGTRAFLLFSMALAATVSLYVLRYLVPDLPFFSAYRNTSSRYRFRAVPMHPQTVYRNHYCNKTMLVTLFSILLVSGGITAAIFSTGTGKSAFPAEEQLFLPAPSRYTDQAGFTPETFEAFLQVREDPSLPDLADFLAVQWKITIFPWTDYRNRLYPPAVGEQMVVYDYLFDEQQGRLMPMPRVVAEFDRDFIRNTLAQKATPLEKMLLKQGRFVSGRITRHP